MSENNTNNVSESIEISGLFAFKEGMATVFDDSGEAVPVTILRYEPWIVTQIKTIESDGYEAIQLSCLPRKAKNSSLAEQGHVKKAGLETACQFTKELRMNIPAGIKLGDSISINSFKKGDQIKLTGKSKGHGFTGVMKRWNFAGGPGSHGSKFHRRPGSSGNRTWPGRVMPGKKFPGHYGDETITVKNIKVVDVLSDESVLFVKGPVPGARNSLVKMVRG